MISKLHAIKALMEMCENAYDDGYRISLKEAKEFVEAVMALGIRDAQADAIARKDIEVVEKLRDHGEA